MAWTLKKYDIGGAGNITVEDEGITIKSDVNTINFVGSDVEAKDEGVANKVNVYIPTPDYASYYNQEDCIIPDISTYNRNVSDPDSTFDIGDWAVGSEHSCINSTTINYNTPNPFSIKNLTTTFTVNVYGADGSSVLATNSITLNGNTTVVLNNISITISDWDLDSGKYKANSQISIDIDSVLGSDSGRFSIEIIHVNSSEGTYTKTQSDIFYDTQSNSAILSGVSITENSPITKFLSGVEYYTTGSTFNVNISDIDYLNSDSYPTDQVGMDASEYGISPNPILLEGSDLTDWTNVWNNTNASYSSDAFTVNTPNFTNISTTANISAYTIDWANGSDINSTEQNILIETHDTTSTRIIEYFYDESWRCASTANFDLPNAKSWTSSNDVLSSDAVFVNGGCERNTTDWTIYSPNSASQPDYTSMDSEVYLYREFVHDGTASSGFTLYINGTYTKFEYKLGKAYDGSSTGGTEWIDGTIAYNSSEWNNGDPTGGTGGQIGDPTHCTFGTNNIVNCNDTLYIKLSFTVGQRIDQLSVIFD